MDNMLNFVQQTIKSRLSDNSLLVDCTMGNGHDTLFLCSLSDNNFVYSFDIQASALLSTENLLISNNCKNYKLILDSHANIKQYIDKPIDIALFNLGYLPKGDKNITTTAKTSVIAIKESLDLLKNGGILCIVVYIGHLEGELESFAINEYIKTLDFRKFNAILHQNINHTRSPYVVIIEKK